MEGTSDGGHERWKSGGGASERIDEDGEEKAGVIGELITNCRRWRWRWRRERNVMEVKKESEGSYVTRLILDSQYLGDSYSNSGKPPVVAASSSVIQPAQARCKCLSCREPSRSVNQPAQQNVSV
jgi:hypothetical protein